MSRFYGSLQGNRGQATRYGTASSGIDAHVGGWDVGVYARVHPCPRCGGDCVTADLTGGSNYARIPSGIGFTFCKACDMGDDS